MKRLLLTILIISLAGFVLAQNTTKLKSNLTIEKSAPMLYLNGTSAGIDFYNGDVTLQQSSNTLTLGGGNFSLGTNSLLGTGSIGATGTRLLKGWFTDLEITNLPTVNGIAFKTALSLTAVDVGLGNVTNESKATMFTNPTFTGTTTLPSTTSIGNVSSTEIGYIDGLTGIAASRQNINDSILQRIATARVGLAASDTNTYGGAATRTFVESLLGSGTGLSAERLPFIIGVTTGAPSASDSTIVHSAFEGKHIDLYRDGAKQYQQFTATNLYEGFRVSGSTITVNPAWQANEQVMVDIIQPILWSYLSLEGQESTLLTGLNAYWKLDESSGTTATDAMGVQNGTLLGSPSRVLGKLNNGVHIGDNDQVIEIPYNTSVTPKGTAFTVGLWVYLDSLPSATGRPGTLFSALNTASPFTSHSIYIQNEAPNADKIYFYSRNTGATEYTALSSSTLSDSTWYNIVCVNRGDGQTMQIYINGTDVTASSGTFSGTVFEPLSRLAFGNAYDGSTSYSPAIIDECAVWGRAITSGEVAEWYNASSGKTHPFN